MQQRHRGFSLVESLVTLLILSIGMLGLGQLQARLWVSSGELHSRDKAHLIATNISTIHEINTFFPPSITSTLAMQHPGITAHFNLEQSVYSSGLITDSDVIVSWEPPSGAASISLHSTFYSAAGSADALWLLTPQ